MRESWERERERESFEIAQYKNGEDQALQRFPFNRDPSRSPWGNRTATVWGVCHVAASTCEIKTGQCEARKVRGHVDGGWWVTRMCGDVDKWTCQVALLSVRVEEDIYWSLHGTEGKVALQSRFSFVCTHQFFASSREFFYFWKIGCLHFLIFLYSNGAIGNVECKTMVKYLKKKKKKIHVMTWQL